MYIHEMMLMVLTHNLAVILFVKELFYRACQEPFLPKTARTEDTKVKYFRGKKICEICGLINYKD